ncbi:hypothetical protein O6H91_04G118700 [Diphasiastrum complanatum]|uniref:Uncharacterized protein n=1 Tax=Diphasiastrum complanatum TaxID=34168 RepID=A0ACC2E110_DIPCM|nr:hypothetical protein O6H91_Y430800 [Diphasiastrum complanatum]KAJ7560221.1 hypothetical protein O6H91_04G118700 [Diphasiastrum complanatum]
MWAQDERDHQHMIVDRLLLGAKGILLTSNSDGVGIRQMVSSPYSLEANWQQAAGLVQSPLSSSSDGGATTSSSQSECPAILPKQILSHAPSSTPTQNIYMSNCLSLVVENQESAMSSDWWWTYDQEHQLSPWPSQPQASPLSSSDLADMEGGDCPSAELAALAPGSTFSERQLHKAVAMNLNDQDGFNSSDRNFIDSDIRGRALEGSSSCNLPWSSLLLGCAGREATPRSESSSAAESLRESFYPRQQFMRSTLQTEGCVMMKPDEMQAWEVAVARDLGLQPSVPSNIHSMYKISPPLHYALAQDDRYSSRLLDPDPFTSIANHQRRSITPNSLPLQEAYSAAIGSFKSDTTASKIKQEPDAFYSISGISLHSLNSSRNINPSGENIDFLTQANRPLLESVAGCELPQLHNFANHDLSSQWGTHSSRLPGMLSQVLPSSASSRHSNPFGSSISKLLFDSSSIRSDRPPFRRLSELMSLPKYGGQASIADSGDPNCSLLNVNLAEEGPDVIDDKRTVITSVSAATESTSEPFFKRPRLDPAPTLPFKVRKEKLGEKITALQQLVSPFGKTDTASVLLEAIGYIKFLHEQVQVLSKPYMKNISTSSRQNEAGKSSWTSDKAKVDGDEPKQDLRSRGLCLVPVSCTQQVANDNGADYWTPAIGGSSR